MKASKERLTILADSGDVSAIAELLTHHLRQGDLSQALSRVRDVYTSTPARVLWVSAKYTPDGEPKHVELLQGQDWRLEDIEWATDGTIRHFARIGGASVPLTWGERAARRFLLRISNGAWVWASLRAPANHPAMMTFARALADLAASPTNETQQRLISERPMLEDFSAHDAWLGQRSILPCTIQTALSYLLRACFKADVAVACRDSVSYISRLAADLPLVANLDTPNIQRYLIHEYLTPG